MSFDKFEKHLHDTSPGFRCFDCSDRTEKLALLARVKNRIGKPASANVVAKANKLFGIVSPALLRFIQLHDGVLLYRDTKSDAAGFEFYKSTLWNSRTKEMQESMDFMGFDEADKPDWLRHGLAFAEIPHSGNYFVIQMAGDGAGQIYYADHDDFDVKPIASSFEQLLKMIISDPPEFLYERGCYTRYSDGKTDIQWIPKEYVPDCNKAR